MKAQYIGRSKSRYTDEIFMFYEYRGHEYMVCDTHNGYMDSDPLWLQHKREQERIDREIEEATNPKPEWTYEGSAQEGFDFAWKYWEEEE